MHEDIKFWQGKRIEHLSSEELRAALVELYRQNEQLSWLVHQQKLIIARHGKKGGRKAAIKSEPMEMELADAA